MPNLPSIGRQTCPVRSHTRPSSLAVKQLPDGRLLPTCFAGCDRDAIVQAWGLTWQDLGWQHAPGVLGFAPSRQPLTEVEQAQRDVLAKAERARRRRDDWAPETEANLRIRILGQLAEAARTVVTRLGPDAEGAWTLASYAAYCERTAGLLAAAMDEGA